jgi:4-diphosphocytidyl-2-C-methyl-D-erythritol kinase
MIIRKTGEDRLKIFAPAKLNLFLEVIEKRPDGYHELDTIMHSVDLYDHLEIRRKGRGSTLHCTGRDVGPDEENLVLEAARLFIARAGKPGGFELLLEKNIPPGSGLGGGSSDCAATLLGCNALAGNPFSFDELMAMGAELGSDVPFFFHCGTARCFGRGERVIPLTPIPPRTFQVIFPGISTPTRRVYENLNLGLTKRKSDPSLLIGLLESGGAAEINDGLYNRLEQPVLRYETEIAEALQKMRDRGFRAMRMSGSGSAFFQLVEEQDFRQEDREFFHKEAHWDCFLVRSSPMYTPMTQGE